MIFFYFTSSVTRRITRKKGVGNQLFLKRISRVLKSVKEIGNQLSNVNRRELLYNVVTQQNATL